MNEFICKAKLKGKGKVRPGLEYAEDRKLAKKGQLGDKLLCDPMKLNMDKHADSIEIIERAAQHLQGGRNAYMSFIMSYPPRVVLSSREIFDDVDRLLFHISKFAYATVQQPREFDEDGKRVRIPKGDRQENVDLRKQPATISIHVDTDNVHAHCAMGIISSVHLQNIRINDGYYMLAFAYARQEVLRERGIIGEDNLLYGVGQRDGRNFVVVKEKMKGTREALDKVTGGQELGVEELGEAVEMSDAGLPKPKLRELAYVLHRHRKHPKFILDVFSASVDRVCPGWQEAKPVEKKLWEENRNFLFQQLEKLNLGIKPGDKGGLVLIANKEHVKMSDVDERWTEQVVEAMTGLAGNNWILGKNQDWQTFLATKWEEKGALEEYAPKYKEICKSAPTEISLPWSEYRVKIKNIGGTNNRRMELAEVKELIQEYRTAGAEDRIVLGKPTTKTQKRLANLYLSPALDAGWRTITIPGIKAGKLETALALDPNLVVREMRDGVEKYNVTFTLRYPVDQREAGINSISVIANDLVRILEAEGWTTTINAPGLPVVRGVGKVSSMPTIVGQPHARVSEPLQALLPAAWKRLIAEERADAVKRAAVLAKQAGLNPDEVVARMEKNSPLRPPLRQVVKCSVNALTLAQRLVPLPPQKQQQKTKEPEKVVKTPPPPQIPPPELQPDDAEEKRRKRKLNEEEKKALLQADKNEIFEK